MEDSISSTNHKINQPPGYGVESSSEDSSWSLYFDNSVASSNVEDTVTCSDSESSSIFSGAAARTKKMYANDDHVESAKSVAKRRKMRPTFIDHDLEDTAISPVCNSRVQDLEQLHMTMQEIGCGSNVLASLQQNKPDYACLSQEKQNAFNWTGENVHSGSIGKEFNYAGLREKGLCLVPVSLLFQVW